MVRRLESSVMLSESRYRETNRELARELNDLKQHLARLEADANRQISSLKDENFKLKQENKELRACQRKYIAIEQIIRDTEKRLSLKQASINHSDLKALDCCETQNTQEISVRCLEVISEIQNKTNPIENTASISEFVAGVVDIDDIDEGPKHDEIDDDNHSDSTASADESQHPGQNNLEPISEHSEIESEGSQKNVQTQSFSDSLEPADVSSVPPIDATERKAVTPSIYKCLDSIVQSPPAEEMIAENMYEGAASVRVDSVKTQHEDKPEKLASTNSTYEKDSGDADMQTPTALRLSTNMTNSQSPIRPMTRASKLINLDVFHSTPVPGSKPAPHALNSFESVHRVDKENHQQSQYELNPNDPEGVVAKDINTKSEMVGRGKKRKQQTLGTTRGRTAAAQKKLDSAPSVDAKRLKETAQESSNPTSKGDTMMTRGRYNLRNKQKLTYTKNGISS